MNLNLHLGFMCGFCIYDRAPFPPLFLLHFFWTSLGSSSVCLHCKVDCFINYQPDVMQCHVVRPHFKGGVVWAISLSETK